MSLTSWAVCQATIGALKGATLAGDGVLDSPLDPIALAVASATPLIAIYDDSDTVRPEGRAILEGLRTMELTLQIFLPEKVSVSAGSAPVPLDIRNGGSAFAISLIYRQVEKALLEAQNTWSALWNVLVVKVISVDARAYVLDTGKVRVPAREVVLTLDIVDSPAFGGAAAEVWPDFLAAMAMDPDLAPFAPVVSAAILGETLPQWRADAVTLGYTPADMLAIGDAPLDGSTTLDVVPMTEGTLDTLPVDPNNPSLTVDLGQPASFGA